MIITALISLINVRNERTDLSERLGLREERLVKLSTELESLKSESSANAKALEGARSETQKAQEKCVKGVILQRQIFRDFFLAKCFL